MYPIILCLLMLMPFGLQASQEHTVLVSVAPHRFYVKQIAGETVDVKLLVPAGDSAHTYEPTPKQMMEACQADAWFQIGESFEKRASAAMTQHNPKMLLVDLRQGIDLLYETHCHACCCHEGADPHIWLSARIGKQQAKTIAEALIKLYPENSKLYQENLAKFTEALDRLDKEISGLFTPSSPKTIVVSHPAYAYFCRDYNLAQVSIEFDGRDPSPQQLTRLIGQIQGLGVRTIYTQPQYSAKGAQLVAKQLGIQVVQLDPYAENVFNAMRSIAQHFSQP